MKKKMYSREVQSAVRLDDSPVDSEHHDGKLGE